jgi:tetratricopeptide (TPR) repeat protein
MGAARLVAALAFACAAAAPLAGCSGGARSPAGSVGALRRDAAESDDAELVGRWALTEELAPGGDARDLDRALARLRKLKDPSMLGATAQGLLAESHGRPRAAADAYLAALDAARSSREPEVPLVAWYVTHRLKSLRLDVFQLYDSHRALLDDVVKHPGGIGWRAAAELADWMEGETYRRADVTGKDFDRFVIKTSGCLTGLRLAGPFGHGSAPDRRRSFDAERPGPWPQTFAADPLRTSPPQILKSKQPSCTVASEEQTASGVYYIEGFFSVDHDRDVVIGVQGALAVLVDDVPVLTRDLRQWGVWQRFGVAVHVPAGRHRVVARVVDDSGSIRVLDPDGRPAPVVAESDERAPYSVVPPRVLPDPNPLAQLVEAQRAPDALSAYFGAYLANVEGMADVADVLVAPYVEPEDAAADMLEAAATYASADAAYPDDVKHTNERALMVRAAKRDPKLWYARAWLVLDDAEQHGFVDAVDPLRKLADELHGQPEILEQLARIYAHLGWRAERKKALADLARRFPDDVRALRMDLEMLDDEGPLGEADKIAARLRALDPDAEVDLDRALARRDWKAAIAELHRLQKRRPDRKELAGRIADVLQRSGDPSQALEQLKKALAKNPLDATSRFRLADRAYALGDGDALRKALADALLAGAKTDDLRTAIDLLEGTTDLEPFRIDGKKAIHEFEAWEKTGKRMAGVSARVLDYSALWVHPDGSAQMLEHEILKMQSQEGINQEAEQKPPEGLVLRLRVIKPDGRTLEPEPVSGKPTLTMPNLEVGDYVEMEHVTTTDGDGDRGRRYRGPMWLFREQDKGYWRSEFVVITPKDKKLDIETRGKVPAPVVREGPTYIERRWRVDESPPLPDEPESVPAVEYLPSVRVGWGVSLADTVARFTDLASDETPIDPRLVALAQSFVKGVPASNRDERARRVYRAVLERVQDGREKDGRRVLLGKSGSREAAFRYAMRALGVPVDLVLVKNRLAPPPVGPMSKVDDYVGVLLRVAGNKGPIYLTVDDRFAPFGYVPADYRGQPGFVLAPSAQSAGPGLAATAITTPKNGSRDGVAISGRADMHRDGSAVVTMEQRFFGKLGIRMRGVFDKVSASQLYAFVEARVLTSTLPGAHVRDVAVENKTNLDAPLVLRVKAEVPQLGRVQGNELLVKPIFPLHLAQLATLPTRQIPLLLGSWTYVDVDFSIVADGALRMPATLPTADLHHGELLVAVRDTVRGHELHLSRTIDLPAGRIQPGAEYADFQRFTRDADTALEREIALGR